MTPHVICLFVLGVALQVTVIQIPTQHAHSDGDFGWHFVKNFMTNEIEDLPMYISTEVTNQHTWSYI